jgi:putative spermidine/putrescine transport system permease protein
MDQQHALRSSLTQALGPLARILQGAAALIGLYLLIPILIIFPMSLSGAPILTWPPDLLSLRWFDAFAESPIWTDALLRSFRIALPVAFMATLLGTLAALGLAYVGRCRRLLQTLFIAPLVLPLITYALGLFEVADRFSLTGSTWPVIIGQTMLAAPLAFVVVSAGLAGRNVDLPRAAASLGAPARTVLWRIELPLLRPSIVAAALIALAYSFDEIIVAFFLLPPGEGTLPVQILRSTQESADPTVAAASIIVTGVAATLGALVLIVRGLVARVRTA